VIRSEKNKLLEGFYSYDRKRSGGSRSEKLFFGFLTQQITEKNRNQKTFGTKINAYITNLYVL
jgi:hypothetical protein